MTSGTKALCVDDRFPPEIVAFYDQLPVKNRIYTIRDIGVGIGVNGQPGEIVVYLDELRNPLSDAPPYPERGFAQFRFREVEPQQEAEELVEAEYADI
jgi:hypothetical protein